MQTKDGMTLDDPVAVCGAAYANRGDSETDMDVILVLRASSSPGGISYQQPSSS